MKRISSIFTVSLLVPILGLTGCGLQKTGTQKVRDLDYTVVTEQELPEELQKGKLMNAYRRLQNDLHAG